MRIPAKLIVPVHHMSNLLHHLLNRVHWAHSVSIAIHHRDGCLVNVVQGDFASHTMLPTLMVVLCVLLETSLDSHLEVMGQSSC